MFREGSIDVEGRKMRREVRFERRKTWRDENIKSGCQTVKKSLCTKHTTTADASSAPGEPGASAPSGAPGEPGACGGKERKGERREEGR